MSCPSGTSSGSSIHANSGSENDYKHITDERKRKRMISNRESARRSRMKKQQLMGDMGNQVSQLRNDNNEIMSRINVTTQLYLNIEAENAILRAQMTELGHRLDSLNEMVNLVNSGIGFYDNDDVDHPFMGTWNQPFLPPTDMFMC